MGSILRAKNLLQNKMCKDCQKFIKCNFTFLGTCDKWRNWSDYIETELKEIFARQKKRAEHISAREKL
jgi:hypothetical protein